MILDPNKPFSVRALKLLSKRVYCFNNPQELIKHYCNIKGSCQYCEMMSFMKNMFIERICRNE